MKPLFIIHTYIQCCLFHQQSCSVDRVTCKLVIVVYLTCQKLCPQCSCSRRRKAEGLLCSHVSNICYIRSHMCNFSAESILSSQALLLHLPSSRNLLPKMKSKSCSRNSTCMQCWAGPCSASAGQFQISFY